MGMMRQGRAPGVQDERGPDPRAQMLRVGGDREQGLGGELKEQVIEAAA
jgi:hypothetical protein